MNGGETMKQAIVASTAIVCITAMEMFAISQGIDGVMLTACVAAVTTIAGFIFGLGHGYTSGDKAGYKRCTEENEAK
jgi:uncharacterized membrane protein YedE/YeeE